jgi:lipopolysaccharide export system permease protein
VKLLDKYLLKSFLITFATVFVILFFIFVLQVVWLFISELTGKDLDFVMILKFLLFKMPSIIPLVLPLSVLLASIMTFGSLAENYEFAAMKSSGISLQRAMRSLIYFICGLSIVAFIFANNVIPFAEYKFVNFRRNIAQVKPALAIAEGQFSQIGTYNIKVEKKSGDNGKFLSGITIHQLSSLGAGSNTVIKAKKGELISSENSNILKLVLKDGNYYEDIVPKKFEDRAKVPFAKSAFKRYVINIDLSKLNSASMNEEQITNTNTMLTVGELSYTLDSLQKNFNKDIVSIAENVNQRSSLTSSGNPYDTTKTAISTTILNDYSDADKIQMLRVALGNVDAAAFSLETSRYELVDKQKNINQHWIALYDKFVIAFSCLLMFFIGAPLGAIIRKGGLGLPIVFAILIFIIFHFINTFGKKVAQQDELSPFLGSWMSTIVLGPLAVLLTKKATDDKGFALNLDFGWALLLLRKIPYVTKFITISNKEELQESHSVLSGDTTTPTLENTATTSTTPIPKKIDKIALAVALSDYKKFSLLALIFNVLLLSVVLSGLLEGLLLMISCILLALLFFGFLFKSQHSLQKIVTPYPSAIDIHTVTLLLGGFPFYILFYFYNRTFLNTILSKTTPPQSHGHHENKA